MYIWNIVRIWLESKSSPSMGWDDDSMIYCGRIECKFNELSCIGNPCCNLDYLYLDDDGKCIEFKLDDSEDDIKISELSVK